MSLWMIRSKTKKDNDTGEPLYWSNEHGWTNQLFECETFTDEEHVDRNTALPRMSRDETVPPHDDEPAKSGVPCGRCSWFESSTT
jgi:hypothetical protein